MSSRSAITKEVKSLQKQLKKVNNNEIQKRIDIILEIADCYRKCGDFDSAVPQYLTVEEEAQRYNLSLDSSFAYRALAEIHTELNNAAEAKMYCDKFRKAAKESQNFSQIQLSYHVSGWVLQRLWAEDPCRPRQLLEEASQYLKRSIRLIKENASGIDSDSKAVESGGDSRKRKARAETLYAGIAGCLGFREEAVAAWNRAHGYAQKHGDQDLKFELLLLRIDFSWENRHVELARKLLNGAPEKKKGAALLELSQAYIFEQDFFSAQKTLYDCLNKHYNNLSEKDRDILDRRIVFLYRYFDAKNKIDDPSLPRQVKRKCSDIIADSLIEFSDDRKVLHTLAIDFYTKMLDFSITIEEKMPAVVSLAETYKEIGNYDQAAHFFSVYLTYEQTKSVRLEKLLETRVAVFICKCRGRLESEPTLRKEFEFLQESINSDKQLFLIISLKETFGDYLMKTSGVASNEYLESAKSLKKILVSRPDSDDEEESQSITGDAEEGLSSYKIIQLCKEEASRMNNEEELIRLKDKSVNGHGETRLHVAARETNTELLEALIKYGYDVNLQDNGGWAPLHEAVSYGIRENVLRLLKAKAKVNVRSEESFEDENGVVMGGGITPLMDACQAGSIQIAKDLLRYGADCTMKNADKWTALDFLRAALLDCDDDEDRVELEKFLQELENRFRERGVPFSREAPTRRRKSLTSCQRKVTRKRCLTNLSPSKANLNEYKSTMEKLSKSARTLSKDNAIFDDCEIENVETSLNKSNDYIDFSPISPLSSVGRHSSLSNRNGLVSDDDLDTCRKRKTSSNNRLYKKTKLSRSTSNNSMRGPNDLELNFYSSPEIINIQNSPQSLGNVHQRGERSQSFTQRSAQNALNLSNSSTPTTQLLVTMNFINPDLSVHSRNKLNFAPTDKMSEVVARCKDILPEYQHNFVIKSCDDCELADDILVSDIKSLEFNCHIPLLTTEMALKSKGLEDPDALIQLKAFDKNGHLDLSTVEIEPYAEELFVALRQSSKRIKILDVSYCGSNVINSELPSVISQDLEVFHAAASSVSNELLEKLHEQDMDQKLNSIILSFTNISDASILANFLSSSNLTQVNVSGLKLQAGITDLANVLCNAKNLKILDISYSQWLTPDILSIIIGSDSGLEELVAKGNDLSHFHFDVPHLPNIKKLVLCGCTITEWDSFLEWLAYAELGYIDLSSTSFSVKHADILLSSRQENPHQLTIRAVRCLQIEHVTELSAMLINHAECPKKPIFQFSTSLMLRLKKSAVIALIKIFLIVIFAHLEFSGRLSLVINEEPFNVSSLV
ncbi:unnamed protein product [Auanema sp. JU1783]|nr:unnamed protein product [Auanema sp. JU1783]